ncbi:MAG: restriction endonuclease [Proteobacteria bacterium]|nr:restriction endonuclease [Pseudomonadota bacterium]
MSEFILYFKERFKELNVDSDEWNLEIDKWNWMGIVLGSLRALKLSEEIYRALYDLLCDLQSCKGRIAKGTPLHQIGWVDLLRGTPESIKRSQYYMKQAMIEDKITVNDRFKNIPAYKVLKGEHNLSEAHLNRLAQWVETYKGKHPGDLCLRPELIYLEYVIDRNNQERSSLYDLDSKLARQLMEEVKRAKTPDEKGSSLEILMAYLFLTSPGFEVLRNLVSFDAQIDLLIRNLHTSDPILDEFGKYIFVECRNIKEKVDAKAIRDFASKVIQASCNSGILITKKGITGDAEMEAARDARMAILKVRLLHGVVIVPLLIDQLELVIEKQVSILDILISEYEKIRFDLT